MSTDEKSLTVLPAESVEKHTSVGLGILSRANLFRVEDKMTYDLALVLRRQIKSAKDAVLREINPVVESTNKAHLAATGLRARLTKNLDSADFVLDARMKAYVKQQREAEKLLQAKQLEEAKRLAAETKETLAVALEKAEEPQRAAAVRAAPIEVPMPVVPNLVPENTARYWKVKSVDILKLAEWIVSKPEFKYFLEAETSKLRKHKIDNPEAEIPGVEYEREDSIRVGKADQ